MGYINSSNNQDLVGGAHGNTHVLVLLSGNPKLKYVSLVNSVCIDLYMWYLMRDKICI